MGLLNQLGLGGISGPTVGQHPYAYSVFSQDQQQYSPYHVFCLHGINCPQCKTEREEKEKQRQEQQNEFTQKKIEYKKRCIKYMDGFRLTKKRKKR